MKWRSVDGVVLLIAGLALAFAIRGWYMYDRNMWEYITCSQTKDVIIP